VLVQEIMHSPVTVLPLTATLGEAYALFERHGFRHLPVVDGKRLVGILSDRDLRFATSSFCATPHTAQDPVSIAMSPRVLTADPLDPVEDAAKIMREHKIGCLPVVDGEDVVGILTGMDLLDALIGLTGVTKPSSRLEVALKDQPGELARLTTFMADRHLNIHSLLTSPSPEGEVRTVLRVDSNQSRMLAEALRAAGFRVLWPPPKPWQP
jgi:acetoin utilization protein AcuB